MHTRKYNTIFQAYLSNQEQLPNKRTRMPTDIIVIEFEKRGNLEQKMIFELCTAWDSPQSQLQKEL